MSETTPCSTCEVSDWASDGRLIPVWENAEEYNKDEAPDYIGCTECNTMEPYPAESD
jgi:hypothetical protein